MIRSRFLPLATSLLVAVAPMVVRAQHAGNAGHAGHGAADVAPAADTSAAAGGEGQDHRAMTDGAMAGRMAESPHLRLTPTGPATAEERRRAAELVAVLRRSIEKYRDVKVAEADGYRMFAPKLKDQPVYHFTSNWRSVKAAFHFDPAEPSSLLYQRNARGELVLVGAMYTAPRNASLDELDARVPLSIARWHRHVDICIPPRTRPNRWSETRDGVLLFGPAGSIATREACDDAGGRWLPSVFGWMVHANVFAGEDEAAIWGAHQH